MSEEEAVPHPEEVWGMIFGKVESVRDMGRLARVSRQFHRLITDAITQVCSIRIGSRWISLKTQLWVDEAEEAEPGKDRFVELTANAPAKALSLVAKVAREAENLEGVFLDLNRSYSTDQEHCALVSQCLRMLTESSKPNLKAFCLFYDENFLPGDNVILLMSAQFIASKTATLKRLSLDILVWKTPLPPPFINALQSCRQLETIKLGFYNDKRDNRVAVVFDSLLAGVHGLKSLQFQFLPNTTSPVIQIFRNNDLRSLRDLVCQFKTLANYVSTCQASKPRGQLFSMGDHPLQNIQELTLSFLPIVFTNENPSFLSTFPFEDFPQLRLLRLDDVDAIELPRMVDNFLSAFRHLPGLEKALEVQVEHLWVEMDKWLEAPPLDDRSLAVAIQNDIGCFCPTPIPPNKKFIYQRGNAAFCIKVDWYYRI